MTQSFGPFDMVARQTLAAVWYEAERIVHGEAVCLYSVCPHSTDMIDLLTAVSRVHPPLYEDKASPPDTAN